MGVKNKNINIMQNDDRFRLQYLSGIGIRKNKKAKFNLVQFVIQINKFLGISNDETNKELKELKDNTDLINPITGQINNPSIASSDNKEEKKEDKNKNDDDNQQNKDNDDDNSQNKDDNDIGDDIEKAKKK